MTVEYFYLRSSLYLNFYNVFYSFQIFQKMDIAPACSSWLLFAQLYDFDRANVLVRGSKR